MGLIRQLCEPEVKIFTVVYWDQRGAGASYSQSPTPANLSLAKIVADGVELAKQLGVEFDQQKNYLQGHPRRALVGINMMAKGLSLFQYQAIRQYKTSGVAVL